jgi:outer membrane lipoprotein SlyB
MSKGFWRLNAAGVALAGALILAGCATQGQNRYSYQDVGRASVVEFGTVLASRQVDIQGKNSGVGGVVGGTAGGLAMSNVGQGGGNVAAIAGGILAGAVAGAVAEQAMSNRVGIEYIITLANGKTITIVQEQAEGDKIFGPGDPVMVQASGTYQRVLTADHLPTEITRPKQVKIAE